MSNKMHSAIEIERKYIIKMPDFSLLEEQDGYTKSDMLQIYLLSEKGETHRIRRRVYSDKIICTETKKMRIDEMSSVEKEREISENEFTELSTFAISDRIPITKSRHTFTFCDQTFEIDVYPQWHSTAVMETELPSCDKIVEMPDFIKIIREVTGNKAYSNAEMSKKFPPEDYL